MKGLLKPLAAATLLGLAACGTDKTSDEYLASANQYLASGQTDAAVIELKNALRQSESNTKARMLLGDLYYERGDFQAAEKEYKLALQAGAAPDIVVPQLALTHYRVSNTEDLEKLANHPYSLSAESEATLSAIQALNALNQGDNDQAKSYLSTAEKKQADNIYARLGHATLSVTTADEANTQQQLVTALESVNEVLLVAPKAIEAHLLKGHLLMAQGEFESAESAFSKVVELAPEAPQYKLYQVQSQARQNKLEQAEPTVDELLKIAPNHPVLNEYKARIHYSREEITQAKAFSEIAVQNGSTSISSFVIAGITSMKEGQPEQAYRYLSQVQSQLPDDNLFARIYAYLQLQLGYTGEAVVTLDKLTDLKGTDAALFAEATSELAKSGDQDKALNYAEKAAALDETGASTAKLGILKLAQQNQEGIADLEQALGINPDLIEARLALVYSLLKQGEAEPARVAADDMIKAFPEDPRGYTLKGLVESRLGELQTGVGYFDKALELAPNNPIALISKANNLIEQDQEPAAFKLLKQSVEHNSDQAYTVRNFITFSLKHERIKEATEWLKPLYEASSSNHNLAWAYAAGLTSSSLKDEALLVLNKIPEEQHSAPVSQLLGDLYLQTNQLEKAEDSYEKWLQLHPRSTKAHLRLIAVNELQKDFSNALKYSQQGLRLFPQSQVFKLFEAAMLYENKQVHAATTALEQLDDKATIHPIAIKLKARLAFQNNQFDEGLSYWIEYYKKQPSIKALVSVAQAYELNQQPQKAIELLEKDMDNFKIQFPAHLKLGQAYLSSNPDKALAHYEAALQEAPDNVIGLNNASWLLVQSKQYPKAEKYAQRAYELSNQQPIIADTYGLSLLRQGKADEALPILQAAFEAESGNAEIAIHYAEALLAKGNKSRAKTVLSVATPESEELSQLKAKLMKQI